MTARKKPVKKVKPRAVEPIEEDTGYSGDFFASTNEADPRYAVYGGGAMTSPVPLRPVEPLPEKQRKILELLDGKAMIGKALAKQLKCTEQSLNRDHLRPLIGSGQVKNDRKIGGYYRPDRPPRS